MNTPTECSASVYNGTGFGAHRCGNKAKVTVDGKGYCGVHDPAKQIAKREAWDRRYERARKLSDARDKVSQTEDALIAAVRQCQGSLPPGVELALNRADWAVAELAKLEEPDDE